MQYYGKMYFRYVCKGKPCRFSHFFANLYMCIVLFFFPVPAYESRDKSYGIKSVSTFILAASSLLHL